MARRSLTDVELEVLRQVARGKNNRQIALFLFKSEDTVRTQLKSIYRKLHATNRTHAVAIAYHVGIFHGRQKAGASASAPDLPQPGAPAQAPCCPTCGTELRSTRDSQ